MLKQSESPFIQKFYHIFEDSDNIYMIMENLLGMNLLNYYKTKTSKIKENEAKKIIYQCCLVIKEL